MRGDFLVATAGLDNSTGEGTLLSLLIGGIILLAYFLSILGVPVFLVLWLLPEFVFLKSSEIPKLGT